MNYNNHKELFDKRVSLDKTEEIQCDNCSETVIFHLKDNKHEFSIGLSTILECLIFAIQQGDIPKLPMSWLADADSICHTAFSDNEKNCYPDINFPRKRE